MDRRLFSVIRSYHAFSAGRSTASFGQDAGSNLIASRNGRGHSLCIFETFVAQSMLHMCRIRRRADRAAKMAPHRLLMAGLVVNGCGILIAGFSTNLWLLMPVQLIIALLQPAIFIGNHALVIKHTEQEYVGRVTGIRTPVMTGAMLLAMSSAGVLKNILSLPAVYGLAGCCFLAGALIMIPFYRR